ncbi:MAG: DUF948 domain-containing protein [Bacilli bacterium]
MGCFNQLMPVIFYGLLSILVVVLIIVCIKLIQTLNKVNQTLDDVNNKMASLNGLFNFVATTGDYIDDASQKVIGFLYDKLNDFVNKKKEKGE